MPSKSSKVRLSSARTTFSVSGRSRCSQKSRAASEPTRQEMVWIIPGPAEPRRAPGYSKNVMSEPALPCSSA
jgi:hypothetical protein